MADLSALFNTAVDEIEIAETPEGFWRGEALFMILGEEKEDRRGEVYRRVAVALKPVEAIDADAAEVKAWHEAGGPEESTVYYSTNIYRKRDVLKFTRALSEAGVPTKGKTLEDLVDELRSGGYEFTFEVKVDEEYGAQATSLAGPEV